MVSPFKHLNAHRIKTRNLPSGTTNLGQSELDTPNLTLIAETKLSDRLQLRVPV
jgi:hypothetical protein